MAAQQGTSGLSDDDAVSLTSTVESVWPADHQFQVEDILYEGQAEEGHTIYLVKWSGYEEHRHTWEPAGNLKMETLSEWADQKMRIARGLAKAFGASAWQERRDAWEAARIRRKERRRQTKIDLGLILATEEASTADHSRNVHSEESDGLQSPDIRSYPSSPAWTAKEESILLDGLSRFKSTDWQFYLKMYGSSGTISKELEHRTEEGLRRKAIELEKAFNESGKDFPIRIQRDKAGASSAGKVGISALPSSRRKQNAKPGARGIASTMPKPPIETLHPTKHLGKITKRSEEPAMRAPKKASGVGESKGAPASSKSLPQTSSTAKATSSSSQLPRRPSLPQTTNDQRPIHLGAVGSGPARAVAPVSKTQQSQGINVMKNWAAEPAKRRKSRYEKISAPEVGQETSLKTFKKFSTRRKHELATRYEHPPDIGSLTFVDLKDPKKISEAPLTVVSKPPPKTVQEPIKEKPEGPSTPVDVAGRPVTQRAATTSASTSVSTPPPLVTRESAISDDVGMADTVVEAVPLGPRRASLPPGAATKRPVSQQQLFAAPVAVMGSGPGASKGMTATAEHHIWTPSEATLPQRRNSAAKKAESSNAQAPGSHSDSRRALDSAVVQSSGLVHHTRQQKPRGPVGSQPEPSSHGGMEPAALRPAATSGDSYSLFPLISRPNPPRADFETLRVRETDIIGQILTGPQGDSTAAVIFRGLDWVLKKRFMSIKVPPRQMHVWCKSMCTAGEFFTIFHHQYSYLGSGWVVPFQQTVEDIDRVSGVLAEHASGGLFFAEQFTLLLYPSNCIVWEFLDQGFRTVGTIPPPEVRLRFAMLEPWTQLQQGIQESALRPRDTGFKIQDLPINAVMRDQFAIQYQRLVNQVKESATPQTKSFILIFPPPAQEEFEIVVGWIRSNGPSSIYKYQDPGTWDHFHQTVDKGVIICHASFSDYWAIPNLLYVLRKSINMFSVSLRPMSPLAPDPYLIRLFPAGAAILLTDSLFIHRPLEAARILAWFRLIQIPNKPAGSWRICTRPAIREWLLNLQAGLTFPYGRDIVSCYGEVARLLPPHMTKQWDRGVPKDEAPIVCMGSGVSNFDQQLGANVSSLVEVDDQVIMSNDLTLFSWFAGWAMTKQEECRRFHIVTGRKDEGDKWKVLKERAKKWNHVDIMAFEKFAKTYDVWDWEGLVKKDGERRAEAKKEAEIAAKEAENHEERSAGRRENDADVEMAEAEEAEESLFLPMDTSPT